MGSSLYWVQRACVGCSSPFYEVPLLPSPRNPVNTYHLSLGAGKLLKGASQPTGKVSVLHHVLPTSANAHVSPDPSSGGPAADKPSATGAKGASGDGALSSTVTITTAGNAHDCLG